MRGYVGARMRSLYDEIRDICGDLSCLCKVPMYG